MEVQRIPKRTVSVIEPQKSILVDKEKYHQKRVAAYCRVSTDSEEQLTSYQNQMRVYTEMISANKEWEFAGLYADEGISGTRADKRPGISAHDPRLPERENRLYHHKICIPICPKHSGVSGICAILKSAGHWHIL